MKFNLSKLPSNCTQPIQVGNVYAVRGGRASSAPNYWILVAMHETMCVLLGINKQGEIVSGTKYYSYTIEKWPVVGFCKDVNTMEFHIELL